MLYVYHFLIVGVLAGFSWVALSKVGPVDPHLEKVAACNNAPTSADNSDYRGINATNVLANLSITVVEPDRKKKPRQRKGRGGSVR